jgi:hypothetical protein
MTMLAELKSIIARRGQHSQGRGPTRVNSPVPVDIAVVDAIREIEECERFVRRATGVDIVYARIELDNALERARGLLDERAGVAFRQRARCNCGGDWLLRMSGTTAVATCQSCWYTEARPIEREAQ